MNKYSVKIYNFIDKINNQFGFDFTNLINIENPFILKIKSIIDKVLDEKIYYQVNAQSILSQLDTDNKYPLLYTFLKKYIEKSKEKNITINLPNPEYFNNHNPLKFREFLLYYLNNSVNIDFDKIKQIIDEINDVDLINLYNKIFDQQGIRKTLHEILYKNPFVGIDVMHYAESVELYYFNVDSDFFNVDLYVEQSFLPDINILMLKIATILSIMKLIADEFNLQRNNNKVKVRILLSKQKKSLFDNYDIIGPINVNSGSTLPGEYVNIWRVEEFEKVLIHEIQHYYGCDFHSSNPNYYLIKNVIDKYFDIDGDDKVNESYNEAMAHIIAMVYFSKIHNIQLADVYHHEMYFLIFQTAKIIEYFNGNKYEAIFRSEKDHIVINQRTSVLSYYLIKTLFMFYINYTINFINQISMKCNDKRSMEILSKFIEIIVKDKTISKYITPLIRLIKKNKSDKFIYKTMRMTGIN
jgi:hypothetical protein